MEYNITFSGRFTYRAGFAIAPHYHADYQIQLVYSGEGESHVNGKPFRMAKGSLILVPRGSTHDFRVSSEEGMKTVELKFVSSDPEMDALISQMDICMTDNGKIFDIMSRIVLEGQRKISFYREMSNALLLECILILYRMVHRTSISVFETSPAENESRGKSTAGLMDMVDDYIVRNMHNKISPVDIAAACGYNQDYLYRMIRKQTGVSAIGYINRKKFEWAKQLIMHTELSLSEIAWNLGFETLQYFSRFFKECAGIPPSEYSRNVRSTIRTDY
ncbi:hypothetical protein FACS1894110_02730 [Spirochaetia bacterium]|nr:hypothetical protein FACS1894110_02730 [Spirochaetia bacterium]